MADLKLSAIFLAAVSMLPIRVSVIPRYLNSVTNSRGVCAVVRERGNCRVTPAEEDHDFCFVSVELEPFETCIYSHRMCSVGAADFQLCLK
jgi:hypothetical protein